MRNYFISDLHLKPGAERLVEAFHEFVNSQVLGAEALFILGDFFDAWIGDDEDHPFYRDLIAKLRSYSDTGLKIYFQHGNRDFLVGERFATDTGITLLKEEHLIDLAGDKALLMHGDSLCIDDASYMQFRAQVRNPEWQHQILALPLQQRRAMAEQLREQSQSMNAMKAEDIMDVNAAEVASVMKNHSVKTLIHGHTHRPNVHNHPDSKRIVLGDWGEQGWYAFTQGKDISLHSFAIR